MKKKNFNVERLKNKIVLPLFMLIGLFLFSAASVNAQSYVSGQEAKRLLDARITDNPEVLKMTNESTTGDIAQIDRIFGVLLMDKLNSVDGVARAMYDVEEILAARVKAGALALVRQDYYDLLTK